MFILYISPYAVLYIPRLCCFFVYRFQIAIKAPRNRSANETYLFLEEAKSMFEIGEYHENIVNLQGITYGKKDGGGCFPEVRAEWVCQFKFNLSIIINLSCELRIKIS